MTCETMREPLLEAELEELRGVGNSPVAVHVRECARCRAVAERLLADTRLLGAAVARSSAHAAPLSPVVRRPRVRRSGYLAIGTLAAAVLAFVIVTRGGDRAVTPAAPVAPEITPDITQPASAADPTRVASTVWPHTLPAAVEGRTAADDTARVAHSPVARPPLEHAVRPRPLPAARAVAPTPLAPRAATQPLLAAEASPVVSVAPPRGKRAAIMRTPDPVITVVWLY